MSIYLHNMFKVLNIFLVISLAATGIIACAEEKYPFKLEFEKLSGRQVSALFDNHSVPRIIALNWNKANERSLSRPPSGTIAKYDLNNDGIEEVFLYTTGYGMCGSGGCHLIIFQFNKENKTLEYKTILSSSSDILILNSLTHGYHNIAIRLMDGISMAKAEEYTLYHWKNGDLVQIDETIKFQPSAANCD